MSESRIVRKSVETPDEVRQFPNGSGSIRILALGEHTIGYAQYKPGWRWSKDIKPLAGTTSCQMDHNIYCLSGKMVVNMDDGTRVEIGPGDAIHVPPGHDAWVAGNETCVALDFTGAAGFAKPK